MGSGGDSFIKEYGVSQENLLKVLMVIDGLTSCKMLLLSSTPWLTLTLPQDYQIVRELYYWATQEVLLEDTPPVRRDQWERQPTTNGGEETHPDNWGATQESSAEGRRRVPEDLQAWDCWV